VKCVPLDDYSQIDELIKRLEKYDWLIFTSPNGVRFFFEQLRLSRLDARALSRIKVAAIGKTTAGELSSCGISADLVPTGRRPSEDNESSAGLLEKFGSLDMKNKNIFLPRAEAASSELSEGLTKLGAVVEEAAVYKTTEIEPAEVDFDYIDIILFTSASVVRAFVKKFGKVPSHTRQGEARRSPIKAYCLGLPTLAEAKEHGIDAEIMPRPNSS